jgi:hypothetical protein
MGLIQNFGWDAAIAAGDRTPARGDTGGEAAGSRARARLDPSTQSRRDAAGGPGTAQSGASEAGETRAGRNGTCAHRAARKLAFIRRAQPFPAPPADIADDQLSFMVPIRYAAARR